MRSSAIVRGVMGSASSTAGGAAGGAGMPAGSGFTATAGTAIAASGRSSIAWQSFHCWGSSISAARANSASKWRCSSAAKARAGAFPTAAFSTSSRQTN